MPVLRWNHGKQQEEARRELQAELGRSKHAGSVTWKDNQASGSVGPWGKLLTFSGEVTDEIVVIDRCDGMFSSAVLKECRRVLEQLFPGGEVAG